MTPVTFGNGITGISRVQNSTNETDFPKSKSSLKPSGKKVVDHTWKALDMSKSLAQQELKFATNIPAAIVHASPEEHYRLTRQAIKSLADCLNKEKQNKKKAKAIQGALDVIEQAKEDSEYLMMCRNVLIAS
ncbi:hypothetical protein [Endozoicomonas ascidiicola]|uniref:hypothetical protein n=1 Tax=Endozoicomonas ascidiicola TaxID=1698521 RepID=UPI000835F337|nr:hypothetical protein [Endozoicomonas ascidiicola]